MPTSNRGIYALSRHHRLAKPESRPAPATLSPARVMPPHPHHPPFTLASFPDGAVLLHLRTGACFRLNATAADICRDLLQGRSIAAIAEGLAERFGIGSEQAAADVRATLRALHEVPPRKPLEEPLSYEATQTHHFLRIHGRAVLRVDPENALVRIEEPPTASELSDAIDGVVPKLLALRGLLVLHASAVVDGDGVRAFSGPSGAGKTTTARAFADAGSVLVSEDLLVLRPEDEMAHAVLHAEARVRAWAEQAKAALSQDPRTSVAFAHLDRLSEGPASPLESVLFLDAKRRRGEAIELTPLAPPDALMDLFGNAFLASADPADWRTTLTQLAQAAKTTRAYMATMPEGIAEVQAAVRSPLPR